ncbi:cytochrome c5 [Catenulispora sp. GP43]
MRMKRTVSAVAISTLALAGVGLAGATAAHADVYTTDCNNYHDARLTGGPKQ